jgi:hypothetical protein
MNNKIPLTQISPNCHTQKGFDSRGCYNSNCQDLCCKCLIEDKFGADFDKESYELVIKHKDLIQPLVNRPIETCFDTKFSGDKHFRGNNSIRSLKGENDYCVFHKKDKKGCILYDLVLNSDIDLRIIPSICRLFPLTWDKHTLIVYNEQKDSFIPKDCNCSDSTNTTSKTLLETQKSAIADIFYKLKN